MVTGTGIKVGVIGDGIAGIANSQASGDIPVTSTDSSKLLPQYEPVADLIDAGKTAQYPYIDWPNGEVYTARKELLPGARGPGKCPQADLVLGTVVGEDLLGQGRVVAAVGVPDE